MSLYDSKDLMSVKGAAREYGVPATTLEMAITQGALRFTESNGEKWLQRYDIEQLTKRMVKRGAGNRVVTRISPQGSSGASGTSTP